MGKLIAHSVKLFIIFIVLIINTIIMEKFIDITGFEGRYQVSNVGNIKSLERLATGGCGNRYRPERILVNGTNRHGYKTIGLWNNGKYTTKTIHRIVAIAFITNPENKRTVNHIDGVRTNNNVINLEWATDSENQKHAYEKLNRVPTFLGRFGKDHVSSKPIIQTTKSGEYVAEFDSQLEAKKETGINNGSISDCCKGVRQSAGGYKWKFKT